MYFFVKVFFESHDMNMNKKIRIVPKVFKVELSKIIGLLLAKEVLF